MGYVKTKAGLESVFEQANPHTSGFVNWFAVDFHGSVCNREDEFSFHYAFDVDLIRDQFVLGQNLPGEFQFAYAESATFSSVAIPSEIESGKLPEGIESETTGHDRVTLEMTFEEPEVRFDIEFSDNLPFSISATVAIYFDNAIEHQHIWLGKLWCIETKNLTATDG